MKLYLKKEKKNYTSTLYICYSTMIIIISNIYIRRYCRHSTAMSREIIQYNHKKT